MNPSEIKLLLHVLPQTDCILYTVLTKTRLSYSQLDTRCTVKHRQLSSDQHKQKDIVVCVSQHKDHLNFCSFIDPNCSTQLLMCLTQREANTPYASALFQSFSQHAFWTKSRSSYMLSACCLPYLLDVAEG